MRHLEQTKSDTDTPEKKNDVSTASLLHTVVFIDCAGLLVSSAIGWLLVISSMSQRIDFTDRLNRKLTGKPLKTL